MPVNKHTILFTSCVMTDKLYVRLSERLTVCLTSATLWAVLSDVLQKMCTLVPFHIQAKRHAHVRHSKNKNKP